MQFEHIEEVIEQLRHLGFASLIRSGLGRRSIAFSASLRFDMGRWGPKSRRLATDQHGYPRVYNLRWRAKRRSIIIDKVARILACSWRE